MKTIQIQSAKSLLRGIRQAIQEKLRDQSGDTLVEVATVMPVLLLLLLGFVGFSLILFDYENLNYACKQAARYASLHSSTSLAPCTSTDVAAVVSQFHIISSQTPTISVSWPNGNTIGNTVIVSVNANYPIAIPFSSLSIVPVSASAQRTIMR